MLVLAVDDDADDLETLKELLRQYTRRLSVFTARNGMEAINYVKEDIIAVPDVIFLDINMPMLNGKDTLLALRELHDFRRVKVIMFSTAVSPSDRQFFANNDAEYETKPSSITDWVSVVHKSVMPFLPA